MLTVFILPVVHDPAHSSNINFVYTCMYVDC